MPRSILVSFILKKSPLVFCLLINICIKCDHKKKRRVILTPFSDHADHRRYFLGFNYKRDPVLGIFLQCTIGVHVQERNEALLNLLTEPNEGRYILWRVSVFINNWCENNHASVDITEASMLG